jgi:hypothetical protein
MQRLAPYLSREQKIWTLAAAKTIGDKRSRVEALGSLAPHLSREQKIQTLAATKAIGDEWHRAQALGSLAPHLSPEQIAEALAAAKAIGDERYRARALGSLGPHVSMIHYTTLLDSLTETAARIPRGQALSAVSASMRISAALGGTEELVRIGQAISDTARWYP